MTTASTNFASSIFIKQPSTSPSTSSLSSSMSDSSTLSQGSSFSSVSPDDFNPQGVQLPSVHVLLGEGRYGEQGEDNVAFWTPDHATTAFDATTTDRSSYQQFSYYYPAPPPFPHHEQQQHQYQQDYQPMLPPPSPPDSDMWLSASSSEDQILTPEELDAIFDSFAAAVDGTGQHTDSLCSLEDDEKLVKALSTITII